MPTRVTTSIETFLIKYKRIYERECSYRNEHSLCFYSSLPYEENELPVITPSTAVAIVITIFRIVLHLELGILLIFVPPLRCNKSTSMQ